MTPPAGAAKSALERHRRLSHAIDSEDRRIPFGSIKPGRDLSPRRHRHGVVTQLVRRCRSRQIGRGRIRWGSRCAHHCGVAGVDDNTRTASGSAGIVCSSISL
jgi:hypothetical protein